MAEVAEVPLGSGLLVGVQRLWRSESETLGFLPTGAFEEHARKRSLLAVADPAGEVLGYVLFRVTGRRQAAIVHLCVRPTSRRQGVARQLFAAVCQRVAECDDIVVRCRRDFAENALWPRLGFIAVGEAAGRSQVGTVLTVWRYELRPLPLLAVAVGRRSPTALLAAIDANVFYDLDPETPGREESKALQADWLGEFVELAITHEIYNEIHRHEDPARRERQRQRVEQFRILPIDKDREERIAAELRQLFAEASTANDWSDRQHLAKTIAADVTYFVTRDGELSRRADDLYERFGIVVLAPHELVLRLDELRREEEYRPQRMFLGPAVTERCPRAADLAAIAGLLHSGQPAPEPRRHTVGRLQELLADPDRYEGTLVEKDGGLLVAIMIERPVPDVLRVPLLAVSSGSLGGTAARHYVERISMIAADEGRRIVEIEPTAGGRRVEDVLAEAGFEREAHAWIKFAMPLATSAGGLAADLARVGDLYPPCASVARQYASLLGSMDPKGTAESSPTRAAELERILWPAKLTGMGVPCFIVPIQPRWAKELFDTDLASATLFGAAPGLSLNWENAYYRSAAQRILTAPGRVLWYVSGDEAYAGSMAIRACSSLDEVVVAPPADAFRRFRRLGVYTWNNVLEVAKREEDRDVMAFRFSHTERFRHRVPFARLQAVLRDHTGRGSQIQSPLAVEERCFMELYSLGKNGTANVR